METEHNPGVKTAIVTAIAALAGVIAVAITAFFPAPPRDVPQRLVVFIQMQLFVTTFNFVLLLALLRSYTSLYRGLPNKYTRSLILLCCSLLLYALTANPVVHKLLGFRVPPGTSPFDFLPHVFVGAAIVVLFYQSQA